MTSTNTELNQKAPADEVRRVVAEFTRLTNLSSEYSGNAGQYLRNQIERIGVSAKLIRKLRSMERQDDAKRQAEIRETLHGWIAMGYLDQVDAFDDLVEDLRSILSRATGKAPEAEASSEASPQSEAAPEAEPKARRSRGGKGKPDPVLESLVH